MLVFRRLFCNGDVYYYGVIFPYIFNDGFDFKEQLIKCAFSGVLFGGIMFIYYMIMLKRILTIIQLLNYYIINSYNA